MNRLSLIIAVLGLVLTGTAANAQFAAVPQCRSTARPPPPAIRGSRIDERILNGDFMAGSIPVRESGAIEF